MNHINPQLFIFYDITAQSQWSLLISPQKTDIYIEELEPGKDNLCALINLLKTGKQANFTWTTVTKSAKRPEMEDYFHNVLCIRIKPNVTFNQRSILIFVPLVSLKYLGMLWR